MIERHTLFVTRALVLATFFLALVPTGSSATSAAQSKATLRLVQSGTLVVRGAHFLAGERVRVTVVTERTLAKRTTAAGNGSFAVRFDVLLDRCNAATVTATGNRGSRARVKLPQRMCPPRL
jgi:hypothetical protein